MLPNLASLAWANHVRRHLQIPDGYTSIKEETSLMAGKAFFVPGSTERSWNTTTPSTRILVRNDLHQQVTSFHMVGCLLQGLSWSPHT